MAEPQLDQIQALVAGRLLDRVDHHSGLETRRLTDDELTTPAVVSTAAAQTMVTSSRKLPHESRPAAAGATANMLAERFDKLPRLLDEWNTRGLDVGEEARRYGAALGDETAAAVRGFEVRPPDPSVIPDRGQAAAAAFATDPAVPPLTSIRTPSTTPQRATTPKPPTPGRGPNSPSL